MAGRGEVGAGMKDIVMELDGGMGRVRVYVVLRIPGLELRNSTGRRRIAYEGVILRYKHE